MHPAATPLITCLDGVGKITIDGVDYLLHEGESIVSPPGIPTLYTASKHSKCCLL